MYVLNNNVFQMAFPFVTEHRTFPLLRRFFFSLKFILSPNMYQGQPFIWFSFWGVYLVLIPLFIVLM